MIKDIDKQRIITIISMFMPNAKIYLFGSHARGDARPTSDIDIAIDNKEQIPLALRGQIMNMIDALNLLVPVEIVDFQSIPVFMQDKIRQQGIVWKG
jgi:predicted nucleotidyltransferase